MRAEHMEYMDANAARFAELDALARSDSGGEGAGGVDEDTGEEEDEVLDVIVVQGLDVGIEGPLDNSEGLDGDSGFGRTDMMAAQLERELEGDSGGG